MRYLKFPTVRIHSWGGLGSQLLALGVLLDLRHRHTRRDFQLILHSSGVTRRISQVNLLAELVQITFIDDYMSPISDKTSEQANYKKLIHSSLKSALNTTKWVISKDSSTFRIFPWTTSIRCHYGFVAISKESISMISKYIPNISEILASHSDRPLGVHYRAGDLLIEKSSSLISIDVISDLVTKIAHNNSLKQAKLQILSDSPLNKESLASLESFDYSWESKETWETIRILLNSHSFIGTNSKISLWVALFRWALEIPGEVFLPYSLYQQFIRITKSPKNQGGAFKCNPY
jgi:hypothetical protein